MVADDEHARPRDPERELVGEDRRVDAERLVAAAHERAGCLVDARRRYEDVLMEGLDVQSPSSFSASLSVLTSSVGFLAVASSVSPRRLTQITGTLSLI